MIDIKSNLCITYKKGQANFNINKRKFDHGFSEIVDNRSREGSCGVNVASKPIFLITEGNMINVLDEKTFKEINQIFVPLEVSDSEDPIEIIKL